MPHNEQKWILYKVDHWSKFTFACPIPSKSARDVADVLQRHVLSLFGLLSILQSDNGHDFVNKLIEEVATTWLSQVQIVRVSGHPQS